MTLPSLLDRALAYGPLYRKGLSNHLPMALTALDRLGAAPADLQRFFDGYEGRLEVQTEPRETRSLADLDRLAEGIGGAAFHGLIRTAYALEAGHAEELQAALEAWHVSWLPLGRSRQLVLACPIERPQGPNIHERMRGVANHPEFQQGLVSDGATATLDEVRDFALRAFWASRGDFTALHLVTATHAFRVVNEHHPLPIEPFLAALSAAFLTLKPMDLDVEVPATDATWDELTRAAIASPDDHTIKLVHTCREEERATGDTRFRKLAAFRIRGSQAS